MVDDNSSFVLESDHHGGIRSRVLIPSQILRVYALSFESVFDHVPDSIFAINSIDSIIKTESDRAHSVISPVSTHSALILIGRDFISVVDAHHAVSFV